MQLFNSKKDYGAIPQALHWLTVFLVALAWALGTFDDVLPKGGPRDSGLFVHICAGIAILSLLVARLTWRLVDPAPPPEATEFGNWMHSGWILPLRSRTTAFMCCWWRFLSLALCFSLRVAMPCRYLVWPRFHRHGSRTVPWPIA